MFYVRVLLGWGILLATAGLGLAQQGIWSTTPRMQELLIWTVGVVSAILIWDSAYATKRARRLDNLRVGIVPHLMNLRVLIERETGVGVAEIGVAVYVVHRRWFRRRLKRVWGLRRGRAPAQSLVHWRPGKGVIGVCVKNAQGLAADLDDLNAKFELMAAREWSRLPSDERLGLSAKEMKSVRGKYQLVGAVPILGDPKPIGCVVVDAPRGSLADVFTDDVFDLMGDAARAIESLSE
jgi:hypothetical protein